MDFIQYVVGKVYPGGFYDDFKSLALKSPFLVSFLNNKMILNSPFNLKHLKIFSRINVLTMKVKSDYSVLLKRKFKIKNFLT